MSGGNVVSPFAAEAGDGCSAPIKELADGRALYPHTLPSGACGYADGTVWVPSKAFAGKGAWVPSTEAATLQTASFRSLLPPWLVVSGLLAAFAVLLFRSARP